MGRLGNRWFPQEVPLIVPRILSTGLSLPQKVLTNDQLAVRIGTTATWIFDHTGIKERRIAEDDQATSDLAMEAGREALQNAGVDPSLVDLVLVATSTPDFLGFPSTASLVQHGLGAVKAGAMDLSAASTGFVYALETARAFFAAGTARYILVIGAEVLSRIVDWSDRNTCILFGDGAAAVLVGPSSADLPEPWFATSLLRSDGRGGQALLRPAGGTRKPTAEKPSDLMVSMDGRRVYSFAITVMKDIILEILGRNGLSLDDVGWVVPHQANGRIVASAAHRLGLSLDRFYLNLERYGNTWGASIPLALAEMDQKGLLKRGQLVVSVGYGAGLTWGANLFRW
jgi:3-oxoacyl-[acyl-carrier-protein] synthase-3